MKTNRLLELFSAGKPAVAGWMSIDSAFAAELVGSSGFDAVVIDCQHGMAEDDVALACLVAQAQAVGLQRFAHQLAYAQQRPGLLAPRQALQLPVLAISGEHDSLCPPEQSDEIVALVAPPWPATHHRLPGAGHLFPMQQAAMVAAHLHSFLARLATLKEPCP